MIENRDGSCGPVENVVLKRFAEGISENVKSVHSGIAEELQARRVINEKDDKDDGPSIQQQINNLKYAVNRILIHLGFD